MIPLSRLNDQTTSERDGVAPSDAPATQSDIDDKLDRYVADVVERRFTEPEAEPKERKSLDELLEQNIRKAEADYEDRASEERGAEHRAVVESRYPAGDVNKAIDMFRRWADVFRENPGVAANMLASSYYANPLVGDPGASDAKADTPTGNKLDEI